MREEVHKDGCGYDGNITWVTYLRYWCGSRYFWEGCGNDVRAWPMRFIQSEQCVMFHYELLSGHREQADGERLSRRWLTR